MSRARMIPCRASYSESSKSSVVGMERAVAARGESINERKANHSLISNAGYHVPIDW
jgi:hypothetical protein